MTSARADGNGREPLNPASLFMGGYGAVDPEKSVDHAQLAEDKCIVERSFVQPVVAA